MTFKSKLGRYTETCKTRSVEKKNEKNEKDRIRLVNESKGTHWICI